MKFRKLFLLLGFPFLLTGCGVFSHAEDGAATIDPINAAPRIFAMHYRTSNGEIKDEISVYPEEKFTLEILFDNNFDVTLSSIKITGITYQLANNDFTFNNTQFAKEFSYENPGQFKHTVEEYSYVYQNQTYTKKLEEKEKKSLSYTVEKVGSAPVIENFTVETTYSAVKAKFHINDADDVIKNGAKIKLIDIKNNEFNLEKQLSKDMNEVIFDGVGQNVKFKIEFEYTKIDAAGSRTTNFYTSEEFVTKTGLAITRYDAGATNATVVINNIMKATFKEAFIYNSEYPDIGDSSYDSKTDILTVTNLPPKTQITIYLSYLIPGSETKVNEIKVSFATRDIDPPTWNLKNVKVETDFIEFDMELVDKDDTYEEFKITYFGENEEETTISYGSNVRHIKYYSLLSDHNYTIIITTTYRVPIKNIYKESAQTFKYKTKAIDVPTFEITDEQISSNKFSFLIQGNASCDIVTKKESDNTSVIGTYFHNRYTCENLEPSTNYISTITYKYDLNDGEGEHIVNVTKKIKTTKKEINNVELNVTTERDYINFSVEIKDDDNSYKSSLTELIKKDTKEVVKTEKQLNGYFINLEFGTTYIVRNTITYFNGEIETNKVSEKEITILNRTEKPKATINFTKISYTSANFEASLSDDQKYGNNLKDVSFSIFDKETNNVVLKYKEVPMNFSDRVAHLYENTVYVAQYKFTYKDNYGVEATDVFNKEFTTLKHEALLLGVEVIGNDHNSFLENRETFIKLSFNEDLNAEVLSGVVNGVKLKAMHMPVEDWYGFKIDMRLHKGELGDKTYTIEKLEFYQYLHDSHFERTYTTNNQAVGHMSDAPNIVSIYHQDSKNIYCFSGMKGAWEAIVYNPNHYKIVKIGDGFDQHDVIYQEKIDDKYERIRFAPQFSNLNFTPNAHLIYLDELGHQVVGGFIEGTIDFLYEAQNNGFKPINNLQDFLDADFTKFNYVLNTDLDLNGVEFEGKDISNHLFDGNGHTISNYSLKLNASQTLKKEHGIFNTAKKAYITNLNADNINIDVFNIGDSCTGGIVAYAIDSYIYNCKVTNSNLSSYIGTGSIAGRINHTYIFNSTAINNTISGLYCGGIVGSSLYKTGELFLSSDITFSYLDLINLNAQSDAGGVVGYADNSMVTVNNVVINRLNFVNLTLHNGIIFANTFIDNPGGDAFDEPPIANQFIINSVTTDDVFNSQENTIYFSEILVDQGFVNLDNIDPIFHESILKSKSTDLCFLFILDSHHVSDKYLGYDKILITEEIANNPLFYERVFDLYYGNFLYPTIDINNYILPTIDHASKTKYIQ